MVMRITKLALFSILCLLNIFNMPESLLPVYDLPNNYENQTPVNGGPEREDV